VAARPVADQVGLARRLPVKGSKKCFLGLRGHCGRLPAVAIRIERIGIGMIYQKYVETRASATRTSPYIPGRTGSPSVWAGKGSWRDNVRPGLASAMPENTRHAFGKRTRPLRDLIGVDIKLLRQFGQRPLAAGRGQSHFCLDGRFLVPTGALHHLISVLGQSCGCQAENPLIDVSRFAEQPLEPLIPLAKTGSRLRRTDTRRGERYLPSATHRLPLAFFAP